jgi:hypothetical protein
MPGAQGRAVFGFWTARPHPTNNISIKDQLLMDISNIATQVHDLASRAKEIGRSLAAHRRQSLAVHHPDPNVQVDPRLDAWCHNIGSLCGEFASAVEAQAASAPPIKSSKPRGFLASLATATAGR